MKSSSDDSDIIDDDDDEDKEEDEDEDDEEENNDTSTNKTEKDGTDSRTVASDESAQDDYHDKSLNNSAFTATPRQTRRITITLRDRRARSALQTLKRSQILKHIQKSIQEQGLHVKVTKCEKHAGRRANFWVRAQSRRGAGILRKEWDVSAVEVFGRGAYMQESDGFVGMV